MESTPLETPTESIFITDPKDLPKKAAKKQSKEKKRDAKLLRKAAGVIWEDTTLDEWPENDYRIFCGDLGNEVSDQILSNAFRKYPSFCKAKVVRDKVTGKSRGYGFVSLLKETCYIRAMREMNGKHVGNRPIRLKRSKWRDKCLVGGTSKTEAKFKKKALF
uniref:RRM domain-containing protein n=1 Tax=Euplotes harpa TaxID=151035 RepID=A0A7S3J7J5_9SPIT|mmetsp:Transcript_24194/g.27908  ORF Transcript_24194/g.27908 Transcript_24194/m.27908 type:complete len:162 (+) Transcript_24194:33-518(+)